LSKHVVVAPLEFCDVHRLEVIAPVTGDAFAVVMRLLFDAFLAAGCLFLKAVSFGDFKECFGCEVSAVDCFV